MYFWILFTLFISVDYVHSAQPDTNAVAQQTFRAIDTNHDGTLQESEINKAISAFDANGDNVVSCNEYVAASTLSDAVSRKIYDYYDNECSCSLKFIYIKSLFLGMDDNNDDSISQKEYIHHFTEVLELIEGSGSQSSRQIFNCNDLIFMAMSAFKALDVDHDHLFSTTEETTLVTSMDTNGDGNVTCNEYILASAFPRNLSRYIFFHFDSETDGDCSMTKQEILKFLTGMDADGDGSISQSEFQKQFIKVIKLMQHGTQLPQGQSANIGDITALTQASFAAIDTNSNGQIETSEWNTALNALDLNGDKNVTCHEYFTVSTYPLVLSRAIFSLNDADGDCSISLDYLMNVFKTIDGNSDGTVSESEFKSNLQQIAQTLQS